MIYGQNQFVKQEHTNKISVSFSKQITRFWSFQMHFTCWFDNYIQKSR